MACRKYSVSGVNACQWKKDKEKWLTASLTRNAFHGPNTVKRDGKSYVSARELYLWLLLGQNYFFLKIFHYDVLYLRLFHRWIYIVYFTYCIPSNNSYTLTFCSEIKKKKQILMYFTHSIPMHEKQHNTKFHLISLKGTAVDIKYKC
jgi:hypothetical protein